MIQNAINSMFSNISGTAYQMKRDADIEALHKERAAQAAEKQAEAEKKAAESLAANNKARKKINDKLKLLSAKQGELEQKLQEMAAKRSNRKVQGVAPSSVQNITSTEPQLQSISPLQAMILKGVGIG